MPAEELTEKREALESAHSELTAVRLERQRLQSDIGSLQGDLELSQATVTRLNGEIKEKVEAATQGRAREDELNLQMFVVKSDLEDAREAMNKLQARMDQDRERNRKEKDELVAEISRLKVEKQGTYRKTNVCL